MDIKRSFKNIRKIKNFRVKPKNKNYDTTQTYLTVADNTGAKKNHVYSRVR
jgi:hypothetical protein